MIVYKATNEKTGKIMIGTAREIENVIGITACTIRACARDGIKVAKDWKIEKTSEDATKSHQTPKSFWDEWEAVTSALRGKGK